MDRDMMQTIKWVSIAIGSIAGSIIVIGGAGILMTVIGTTIFG